MLLDKPVLKLFEELVRQAPSYLEERQGVGSAHYRLGLAAGGRPAVLLAVGPAEFAVRRNHFTECLKVREELARFYPRDSQGQLDLLLALARTGKKAQFEAAVDRLLDSDRYSTDRQMLFQLACGFAILADGPGMAAADYRDRAFWMLGKLLDLGWKDRGTLETEPDLAALRDDPRYAALLKRLGGAAGN